MSVQNNVSYEKQLIQTERDQKVVRSVNLIQNAQYTLSLEEQRFLLYCISKVKPDDSEHQTYTIALRDYLSVCGLSQKTSYANMKQNIITTLQKMILAIEYSDPDGKTKFMVTNWFDHITLTKEDGLAEFQFSSTVSKELIGLARYNQKVDDANKLYYISDELKYMLPFRCRYSFYLYPLLRSYQNRHEWTFTLEELRERLDVYERLDSDKEYREVYETAEKKGVDKRRPLYERFPDFRRGVLDPAIEDINTYSNIKVAYIVERRGRSVHAITFIFEDKNPREKMQSELRGSRILDRDDDYTQLATEMVPDPENPLRFTQTHKTGTDTTPQSITEPKRSTKPPKTAAEAKERMRETEKLLQEERSRAKKPTNYGKRTDHAPRKRKTNFLDTDRYFNIADLGSNRYAMQTTVPAFREYAALVGGRLGEWAAVNDAATINIFLEFCVDVYGSARLQKYNMERKLKYVSDGENIIIELDGLTCRGDFSRLIHKLFNEKRTAEQAFAIWMR